MVFYKLDIKTILAIGTSIITCLSSTIVLADNTPFEMIELSSGYMNLAKAGMAADAGGSTKMKDGSCGDKKKAESKAMEAKCGDSK